MLGLYYISRGYYVLTGMCEFFLFFFVCCISKLSLRHPRERVGSRPGSAIINGNPESNLGLTALLKDKWTDFQLLAQRSNLLGYLSP